MSDIVERLLAFRPPYGWPEEVSTIVEPPMNKVAATEILRLRTENEKLRAALKGVTSELDQFVQIFKGYQGMTMNSAQSALRAAAAALKETGDE